MRGDRPKEKEYWRKNQKFTPHARGSTAVEARGYTVIPVYPACAGIDPLFHGANGAYIRLPRMRGDRPNILHQPAGRHEFTPHARGSTWHSGALSKSTTVYPACAGIDPTAITPNTSG